MIYLKMNQINGNVSAKNYQGAIEIYNYTFSSERNINSKRSGLVANRSAGLIQYGHLTLTKPMDNATAALLKHYYDAKVIPEISFHHLSTGSEPQCFFVNTFKDVLISGHAMDCDASNVGETFTLSFTSNQKRITSLTAQNKLGSPVSVGYDIETAQAL